MSVDSIVRRLRESRIQEATEEFKYVFNIPWRECIVDDHDYIEYHYKISQMDYANKIMSMAKSDFDDTKLAWYATKDSRTEDCGIISMTMDFNGKGECEVTVITSKELDQDQLAGVISYLEGQMSDGWGEGFEQTEIDRFTVEEEEWIEDDEEEEGGYYDEVEYYCYVYGQFWWYDSTDTPYHIKQVNATNESSAIHIEKPDDLGGHNPKFRVTYSTAQGETTSMTIEATDEESVKNIILNRFKRRGKESPKILSIERIDQNNESYEYDDFRNEVANEIMTQVKRDVKKVLTSENFGFDESDVEDYSAVDVHYKDEFIVVEVRAEVGYEALMELADELNKTASYYDKDAYFDAETAGIISAYIRADEAMKDHVSESKDIDEGSSDYNIMKRSYRHSQKFQDAEKESGDIQDLIDELEHKGIKYDVYKDKKTPGCTIFYEGVNEGEDSMDNFKSIDTYIQPEDRVSMAKLKKSIKDYPVGTYIRYATAGSINASNKNTYGVVRVGEDKWSAYSSLTSSVSSGNSYTDDQLLSTMMKRGAKTIGIKLPR